MIEPHFLHGFLNPKSVALYGANNKGSSLASLQIMNLIKSGYSGKVYPIHLKLESVMGFKAYRTITDVPEIPDLVVIVIPANLVPQIFRECGEKGVKRIVLISGGFRELNGDRKNTLTEEINAIAKEYGIRFIGPNCLGVFNNWYGPEEENKSFNIYIWENLKRSKFSIASQSGTLSCHIWYDPENLDLGLSRSLSVGNEANIDIVDCLEYFKDDPYTEIIGLYIEELKRGKRFLELAREVSRKKPIIAIYVGGSKAGNRALQSHTGALAGDSKIFDALFKETGIIKTDYVQEFLDIALILSRGILPKGNRLGIITNSGGPGAMVANNAEKHGLVVPEFSKELQEKLKEILPITANFKNPIDCTFDMNLPYFYITLPEVLMKSGEVDAIIQYGVVGFQDVIDDYLSYKEIARRAEFNHQTEEVIDALAKKLVQPTIINSRKYSVPILHI
ncbi:MAG: acetate--CoA ligase family protein, partial [Candidatus Odinarchaeota archaeon]